MSSAQIPGPDPRRVRIGLAMVVAVFVISLLLLTVIHDPIGRLVMVGVLLTALVRAYMLRRTIRRGRDA